MAENILAKLIKLNSLYDKLIQIWARASLLTIENRHVKKKIERLLQKISIYNKFDSTSRAINDNIILQIRCELKTLFEICVCTCFGKSF